MIEPQVQWVAPAPLWSGFAKATADTDRARLRRPDILRYATDSFMDEFMGTLANQPERLHEWRAEPETWDSPAPTPAPVTSLPPLVQRLQRLREAAGSPLVANPADRVPALTGTAPSGSTLKLYQPAHQRFYLVTASLVCRIPGLPDRFVNAGSGERVGYVVRRLSRETNAEYAFVDGKRWEPATANDLAVGEEVLPLFGVTYTDHDGRRRRVLAGTIPVARRESYLGAPLGTPTPSPSAAPVDPRKALLQRNVTDPWRAMLQQYDRAYGRIASAALADPPGDPNVLRIQTEDQANLLSWLIVLDLGDYLEKYLPNVWAVVTGNAQPSSLASGSHARALYDALHGAIATDPSTRISHTLVEALVRIRGWRDKLESATVAYSTVPGSATPAGVYPDFLFPLQSDPIRFLVDPPPPGSSKTLDDLVADALTEVNPPARTPPLPLAATTPTLAASGPDGFIIRCVFSRPNCAPLVGPLLSEPTDPFQLATFFDPQAPARPIRIALPFDISPAGLRKFDRNTTLMVSDALCGLISNNLGGMTLGDLVLSVLPWPFHKDLPKPPSGPCANNMGMLCSLSLPIITICAIILLLIFVSLFDIIFHWIPFFITCFPLPNLSAKRSS